MALVTTFMTSPLIRLFAGPAALPLKGDAPGAAPDRAPHR
jgi:hypothetical protein